MMTIMMVTLNKNDKKKIMLFYKKIVVTQLLKEVRPIFIIFCKLFKLPYHM